MWKPRSVGELAENPRLLNFIEKLKQAGGDCHIAGLLSDGGDGLLEVVSYYGEYKNVELKVHDPLFRKINSTYNLSQNGKKALIKTR